MDSSYIAWTTYLYEYASNVPQPDIVTYEPPNSFMVNQPKRVKFTNCSQFLSHNFFGLNFHFYVIFLLIGICQLDNDV